MKYPPIPLQPPPEILGEMAYVNSNATICWVDWHSPAALHEIDFIPDYEYKETENNE